MKRLAAVLALAAIGVGVYVLLGRVDPEGRAAQDHGAETVRFTVKSRAVGKDLGQIAIVPEHAAASGRPLLLFLHGRGGDGNEGMLSDELYAAIAKQGRRAPVVVLANGGDHSYWHDRAGGRWGAYVMRELLPQAAKRLKVDPRRVAIGGISMGGFGAYDLARLHPGRFCAAGGHSPALWQTGGATAPGAFDDGADFARHDMIGTARSSPSALSKQPLWLDAGTSDPFDPGDKAFVAALRANHVPISVHRSPGGHEGAYWRAHYDEYLRFYARALARCG